MSKSIFIFVVLLLVASWSVAAIHPLTVTVESDTATVNVGDQFDLNVYLNLPAGGVASDTLYEASLRFQRETTNFEFVSLASPNVASSVFNPLEVNQPSTGIWVMEGDGGGTESYALSATRALLGRIRVRATTPGAIDLGLGTNMLVQSYGLPPFGANHLFTPSFVMGSVTVGGAAVCNDANPSLCITQATCTAASNYWSVNTCYDACPAGTSDPNSDRVCTATPAGVFTLTSDAFEDGDDIDIRFTCDSDGSGTSDGVNPLLQIRNVLSGTVSLNLIMEDRSTSPFTTHWVVYNIDPGTTTISENSVPLSTTGGAAPQGRNFNGDNVYAGPCPPNDPQETHEYVFTLTALNRVLDLPEGATRSQVLFARQGSFIGGATLRGYYYPGVCAVAMVANGVVGSFPGCVITCNTRFQLDGIMCVAATGCGNEVVAAGESCDDGNTFAETVCPYGQQTCTLCNADCSQALPLTGPYCGDALINGAERCDWTNLDGNDCTDFSSVGGSAFTGGTLSCDSDCTVNTNLCTGAVPAQCTADDCVIGEFCSDVTSECELLDPATLFQQKVSALVRGNCYPTITHPNALYCEDNAPILGTMTTNNGEPDDFRRRVYIIAQTGIALREFFQN